MGFFKNIFNEQINKTKAFSESNTMNLPFPYLILSNGKVKYYNPMFKVEFKITTEESVYEFVELLNLKVNRQILRINDKYYDTYVSAQSTNVKDKIIILVPQKQSQDLRDCDELVIGYVYIDNYFEAINSEESSVKPMVEAIIERKLNSSFKDYNILIQKYDKDKYLIVMKYSEYLKLKSNDFEVIEEIKKVKLTNNINITLSIGLGVNGFNIQESNRFANTAIDLALGRGGDQVILKNGDKFEMFGGNSDEAHVNNKVRARVKSNILCELIEEAENVVVMGHKYPDLDSLGACIGIKKIAQTLNKDCNIILNDVTTSISTVYEKLISESDFLEDTFITTDRSFNYVTKNTLLVIVDVNKKELMENPDIVDLTSKIVLIDHHRRSIDSMKGTVLTYHEPASSSTSELVIDLLAYVKGKPKFSAIEADTLLAGIIIDTKNFTFKTSAKTFDSAAYLKRVGADTKRVNYYLQSDINDYKIKTDIVNRAVIHGEIAISKCYETLDNPNLIISQAADELLNLLGIEVAFVITKLMDTIFISARSFGQFNVQEVMEQLGGGGHKTMAAAQIENKTIDEVEKMLLSTLNLENWEDL